MGIAGRRGLALQLSGLAKLCFDEGNEAAYETVKTSILPHVGVMAADTRSEVRLAAGESLVSIAQNVKPSDMMEHVLSIVLNLAHDLEQEELRMTAAGLFNSLAEYFGPDLCQFFVCPEIISLSEDAVFRVRKSCSLNCCNILWTIVLEVPLSLNSESTA